MPAIQRPRDRHETAVQDLDHDTGRRGKAALMKSPVNLPPEPLLADHPDMSIPQEVDVIRLTLAQPAQGKTLINSDARGGKCQEMRCAYGDLRVE